MQQEYTPLHVAVRKGNKYIVKELVNMCPSEDTHTFIDDHLNVVGTTTTSTYIQITNGVCTVVKACIQEH